MQKILLSALMAALICTAAGCNAKRTTNGIVAIPPGQNTEAPAASSEPTTPPERVDVFGNPIKTGYAEGAFVKAEDGQLSVDADGTIRMFTLSARAENDITALGIEEGTRIIVNFNTLEDGTEEAESLEKIIAE